MVVNKCTDSSGRRTGGLRGDIPGSDQINGKAVGRHRAVNRNAGALEGTPAIKDAFGRLVRGGCGKPSFRQNNGMNMCATPSLCQRQAGRNVASEP